MRLNSPFTQAHLLFPQFLNFSHNDVIEISIFQCDMSDEQVEALLISHGFECKVSGDGRRRSYRTPAPQRRWMDRRDQLEGFLSVEHASGRLLDIRADMFVFGKRKKSIGSFGDVKEGVVVEAKPAPKTTVELLIQQCR